MPATPGVLDRLDLLLLQLAKRRRERLDSSPRFYERFFGNDDSARYTGDVRSAWRFGVMRRAFDRLFPDGEADVADVGCGLGTSLRFLPERARFVGIDISEATLTIARRKARPGVQFRRGGFPQLPLESGSCDFALCLEVLEHLPDDRQAVAELHRVLRPHGHLLVSVPSTFYWPQYRNLIGHFRHYTPRTLAQLLEQGGFEIVDRFPQFRRFWRAYHYLYAVLRAGELLARKLGGKQLSLYESTAYRRLGAALLRRLEARSDKQDPASTLVLCRVALR